MNIRTGQAQTHSTTARYAIAAKNDEATTDTGSPANDSHSDTFQSVKDFAAGAFPILGMSAHPRDPYSGRVVTPKGLIGVGLNLVGTVCGAAAIADLLTAPMPAFGALGILFSAGALVGSGIINAQSSHLRSHYARGF